jgi:8-oxo-dGTP pyrophosphatase MutT (NUDIX family)
LERKCDQSGVVAYRVHGGVLEVLLVTTRTKGRWIIPKGNIEAELGSRGSARREAYEEAGVRGHLHLVPIGHYEYSESSDKHRVEVFLMKVERELSVWPEAHERERQWMPIKQALEVVDEKGLKPILWMAAELLH